MRHLAVAIVCAGLAACAGAPRKSAPPPVAVVLVVASTAVGQMRIRYFGRGLMKDNLKPGWLIRIINKVF